LPLTATGSHQRVRLEKIVVAPPQPCILHATITAYDFNTGVFSASFDAQPIGAPPIEFVPQMDGTYIDNAGRSWKLIN
jgi:hypothetical protein